MYVIPVEGVLVRCPIKKTLLPPEGADVQDSRYWRRRLADGSITVGEPPAEEKPVKGNTKEAKAK